MCPSVTSRHCIRTSGRIGTEASLKCVGLIRVSLELSHSGHGKFRHCRSIVLSTQLVDGRAVVCTCDGRPSNGVDAKRAHSLLHVRRSDCNALTVLTPLLRFVADFVYQLCSGISGIVTLWTWEISPRQIDRVVNTTCVNLIRSLSPYSHTYIIGIPSPTHSFTLGLNPSFSANPPYRSLSLFSFRIHYMDFPDCLRLLLSISVFLLF